jgi:hypothetical protein
VKGIFSFHSTTWAALIFAVFPYFHVSPGWENTDVSKDNLRNYKWMMTQSLIATSTLELELEILVLWSGSKIIIGRHVGESKSDGYIFCKDPF